MKQKENLWPNHWKINKKPFNLSSRNRTVNPKTFAWNTFILSICSPILRCDSNKKSIRQHHLRPCNPHVIRCCKPKPIDRCFCCFRKFQLVCRLWFGYNKLTIYHVRIFFCMLSTHKKMSRGKNDDEDDDDDNDIICCKSFLVAFFVIFQKMPLAHRLTPLSKRTNIRKLRFVRIISI